MSDHRKSKKLTFLCRKGGYTSPFNKIFKDVIDCNTTKENSVKKIATHMNSLLNLDLKYSKPNRD